MISINYKVIVYFIVLCELNAKKIEVSKKYTKQMKCPEGYVISDGSKCKPYCERECYNGKCSKPNICECDEDFKINPQNSLECLPICEDECVNGFCSSPGICSCYGGFEKDDKDQNICNPICNPGCINGNCTRPDYCTCNNNYKKSITDEHICDPICNPECINGKCTAPNICDCYEGYQKSNASDICEPICSNGCENGKCIQPEKCECNQGYTSIKDENDHSRCLCESNLTGSTCTTSTNLDDNSHEKTIIITTVIISLLAVFLVFIIIWIKVKNAPELFQKIFKRRNLITSVEYEANSKSSNVVKQDIKHNDCFNAQHAPVFNDSHTIYAELCFDNIKKNDSKSNKKN